jgi:hypothetical protein
VLEAAEELVRRVVTPHTDEPNEFVTIVRMQVGGHRRDTDQIPGFEAVGRGVMFLDA